ncbi:beta-ketoacyl synthase N-terminal-like domain-containing protein, partial [Streptomyces sp. Act-28]
ASVSTNSGSSAAVRLPTAGTLTAFADLLVEGRDTVGPLPANRRGDAPGPVPHASFLDRVDEFDPVPFRISAREAPLIDPQARIVYETIWEAMEDGGRGGGPPPPPPPPPRGAVLHHPNHPAPRPPPGAPGGAPAPPPTAPGCGSRIATTTTTRSASATAFPRGGAWALRR